MRWYAGLVAVVVGLAFLLGGGYLGATASQDPACGNPQVSISPTDDNFTGETVKVIDFQNMSERHREQFRSARRNDGTAVISYEDHDFWSPTSVNENTHREIPATRVVVYEGEHYEAQVLPHADCGPTFLLDLLVAGLVAVGLVSAGIGGMLVWSADR